MVKSKWEPNWKWWVVSLRNDDGDSPFGFRPFWAASERGAIRQAGEESGAIELETIYSRLHAIPCGRSKSEAETKYNELKGKYGRQQAAYWARVHGPEQLMLPLGS